MLLHGNGVSALHHVRLACFNFYMTGTPRLTALKPQPKVVAFLYQSERTIWATMTC